MRENMPVLRGIAPFRSSSTLEKKQINARKFASFIRGIAPFRSSSILQKNQINARKYASFTRHRTIQIVFHPAKEANKCTKICQFYAASPHSDRLPPCTRTKKKPRKHASFTRHRTIQIVFHRLPPCKRSK